jgi:chromosome segregation ATPase
MIEATDIEKKSLEAHVELCAERYNALEDKMTAMSTNIAHLCDMVTEVKEHVSQLNNQRNNQLLNWAVGSIGVLMAALGYMVSHYVIK